MDVDESEDILHFAAIGKLSPCQQYGKRKLEHAGDAMNMQLIQKLDADQKKGGRPNKGQAMDDETEDILQLAAVSKLKLCK